MKSAISVINGNQNSEYTLFEYAYVDSSNYKAFGEICLFGSITENGCDCIVAKLESSQFFVAEQINIPPLYDKLFAFTNGPTADDHAWHLFEGFKIIGKNDFLYREKSWGTVGEFISVFDRLIAWQPYLSKNFENCSSV